ncbi:MAG TPA: trehalose-6-phosphate synthase [Methylocella sp.]|nr:trehalose-6-phosphate synthase [Methylocella sp.]
MVITPMMNLELLHRPSSVERNTRKGRVVVVSNRVPPPSTASPNVGGLAVALEAALKDSGGLWFGWSGGISEETGCAVRCWYDGGRSLTFAVCDLPRRDVDQYYAGFSNRTLWPICHYRLDLATLCECDAEAYFRVNERFADQLAKLLRPDDLIWVHDYHLIPLACFLRQRGYKNRVGFFLHIPWPAPDVASALPSYENILHCFGAYDLIGFQTEGDAANFRDCLVAASVGRIAGDEWEIDRRRIKIGAFPIGIDNDAFAREARSAENNGAVKRTIMSIADSALVIGVDRLDYSKGLKHRMEAFGKFLERTPRTARSRVTMLQVTPKSRSEVPAYAAMQRELEEEAGRINGKYGDIDWTPLRYINRSLSRSVLAGLYRMSCIGLVTPLRDGMNLVAKEYVAAQSPDTPGVLILSQFAGAAQELKEALIVNPYDIEATAAAIAQAYAMPVEERRQRWQANMDALRANSVFNWSSRFLEALANSDEDSEGEVIGPPLPGAEDLIPLTPLKATRRPTGWKGGSALVS